MKLSLAIARLKDQARLFKSHGGAADLDAAMQGRLPLLPALFVMPLADRAELSKNTGVHSQYITRAFAVVQVLDNRNDATGKNALNVLDDFNAQVRDLMVGWVPDSAVGEPVQFTGGRVLRFEDGRLWWSDEFQVSGYYRSTP